VWWDVRERRIPNRLSALGLVGALLVAAAAGGAALTAALGGLALGAGALLVPFALGAVGGGDVKFAAVASAWLGPRLALNALLLGMALGLLAALVSAARTGRVREAMARAGAFVWLVAATRSLATVGALEPEHPTLTPIPYAVPLAGGVAAAVLLAHRGWLVV
jgi:prepilin peptidase CpaA